MWLHKFSKDRQHLGIWMNDSLAYLFRFIFREVTCVGSPEAALKPAPSNARTRFEFLRHSPKSWIFSSSVGSLSGVVEFDMALMARR